MGRYIIRRLLQAIPLLLLISLLIFVLLQSAGDPLATLGGRQPPRAADRERLRRQLGLDQPWTTQYVIWLIGNEWIWVDEDADGLQDKRPTGGPLRVRYGVLRGDFGDSIVTKTPAIEIILERIPNTLLLMVTSEIIIISFALLIGIVSAVRQYSLLDNLVTGFSFVFFSMPVFVMGFALMYLLAVKFRQWGLPYFPTISNPAQAKNLAELAWYMALPVITLSVISIAAYSRYIRSNMLEVINSDYIRTARSKGLSERSVLYRHAFKNAALPLATLIGLDIPFFLAGAVVTEQIFAWPGMGRLFVDHLDRLDYSVMMGLLILITVAVIFFQLLTDLLYTWLDPRIRYS
ncbi:MAG: ABC transporter permease [Anaerolineae bacterium]|nr:ABC transporter permease [Anaerolineae bacterium]